MAFKDCGRMFTILAIAWTMVSRIIASDNASSTPRAIPTIRAPTTIPFAPVSERSGDLVWAIAVHDTAEHTHRDKDRRHLLEIPSELTESIDQDCKAS